MVSKNDYKSVFQEQSVKMIHGERVDSKTASFLISVLKYLDRIGSCSNHSGDPMTQYMIDDAQHLLRRFHAIEEGDMLSQVEGLALRKLLGDSQVFHNFSSATIDVYGGFTHSVETICRDIIKVDVSNGVLGRCYVDSHHYDQEFARRADSMNFEVVGQQHGVYTLAQPYP